MTCQGKNKDKKASKRVETRGNTYISDLRIMCLPRIQQLPGVPLLIPDSQCMIRRSSDHTVSVQVVIDGKDQVLVAVIKSRSHCEGDGIYESSEEFMRAF